MPDVYVVRDEYGEDQPPLGRATPDHGSGTVSRTVVDRRPVTHPLRRVANRGRTLGKGEGTPAERFWDRVEKSDDGCWLWIAGTKNSGYGVFAPTHGEVHMAHRYAWSLANGPIPAGMHVCHHCDNKLCVRLDHLFLGTPKRNMDDMRAKGRARWGLYNKIKTHCPHGHEYDNSHRDKLGKRVCRECRTWKARQERKAARDAARVA